MKRSEGSVWVSVCWFSTTSNLILDISNIILSWSTMARYYVGLARKTCRHGLVYPWKAPAHRTNTFVYGVHWAFLTKCVRMYVTLLCCKVVFVIYICIQSVHCMCTIKQANHITALRKSVGWLYIAIGVCITPNHTTPQWALLQCNTSCLHFF